MNLLNALIVMAVAITIGVGQPKVTPSAPAPVELTRSLNGAEVRVRLEFRPKAPYEGRHNAQLVVSKEVLQDGVPSWSQLVEVAEPGVSERRIPEPTQKWATSPRSMALELDASRQLIIATSVVSYLGKARVHVWLVPLSDAAPRPRGWKEGQPYNTNTTVVSNPADLPVDKAMLVRYSWKDAEVLRIELLPNAEAEPASTLLLNMESMLFGPEPAEDPVGQ